MRKILIVLPNDVLGGAEQFLHMIGHFFYFKGFTVDVFFLKKKTTNAWNNVNDNRFRLYYTNNVKEKYGVISLFYKLVLNYNTRYDYVFTSHTHVSSFISLLRKLKIVKANYHIARESTSIFKRFTGFKLLVFKYHYSFNYNNIDLLICQTDFMKEQLVESMPSLAKQIKIKVIPNPINLIDLNKKEIRTSVKYYNYIVSAGRLIPEKGFDILIDAFSRIKLDRKDIKLVILGEGQDRRMLEDKIKSLGLQGEVILQGFVDDVYPWFKGAEACVVSSRIEGFPNVLLQMMSQNNKVVSTLCAGGIEDIEGLIIAETNNVESLYTSISQCLENDSTTNRVLFDKELQSRSVDRFLEKIEEYLNE